MKKINLILDNSNLINLEEMNFSPQVFIMPDKEFSDEAFFEFCQANDFFKIERNSKGQIIIMPPTGGMTGNFNSELNADFVIWNRHKKQGKTFDSSTGFKLPTGATYSPDYAWIRLERWEKLTVEQREKFIPICPDFVMELRSKTDSLKAVKDKMKEWMEAGCRLGWLVDPYQEIVYIYKENEEVKEQSFDKRLSGENVLEGFEMDIRLVLEHL